MKDIYLQHLESALQAQANSHAALVRLKALGVHVDGLLTDCNDLIRHINEAIERAPAAPTGRWIIIDENDKPMRYENGTIISFDDASKAEMIAQAMRQEAGLPYKVQPI